MEEINTFRLLTTQGSDFKGGFHYRCVHKDNIYSGPVSLLFPASDWFVFSCGGTQHTHTHRHPLTCQFAKRFLNRCFVPL